MKVRYIAFLAGLAAAPVFAAEHAHEMAHGTTAQQSAAVEATGQINAVDAAAGTVNISHAPIAALGWPAMTMDFALENKGLAAALKPGQAVKFKIRKTGPTDYLISSIEPVK